MHTPCTITYNHTGIALGHRAASCILVPIHAWMVFMMLATAAIPGYRCARSPAERGREAGGLVQREDRGHLVGGQRAAEHHDLVDLPGPETGVFGV